MYIECILLLYPYLQYIQPSMSIHQLIIDDTIISPYNCNRGRSSAVRSLGSCYVVILLMSLLATSGLLLYDGTTLVTRLEYRVLL